MQDNFVNESFENENSQTETSKTTKPVETRITGWTSLKEFSVECGITYEAVRQQVQKHSAVLEGHIKTIGKTRYLDSYAKKFLRGKKVNAKDNLQSSEDSSTTASSQIGTTLNSQSSSTTNTVLKDSCASNTQKFSNTSSIEKINAQKNEISELKKKIRSLEDEIKQIEYDNVISQSIIASMDVREFKAWKNKFKSQMRDTMDI